MERRSDYAAVKDAQL
jgi:hypothetical protein